MAEYAGGKPEIESDEPSSTQDSDDLASAVQAELSDAIDFIDESITPERAQAVRFYNGEMFGTEEEGRSDYVSTDVKDTVLGMMPSLMRVFTSAERIVEYVPMSAEDIPMAEQATDVVHHILHKENPFFSILYSAFKDALIAKTGIIKWWFDESVEITEHMFTGLSEPEIAFLTEAPDTELVEMEIEIEEEIIVTPEGIQQVARPALYSCTVRRESRSGKYKVDAVPPEEFLIDRRARTLDDASLVAHRQIKTVSELIAMGYDADLVNEYATTDDDLEFNEERMERYNDGGDTVLRGDDEGKKALYIEAYIRYPNKDGIAELTRVCTLGGTHDVVNVQPCDQIPFALFCPDPTPHTVIGESVADSTIDIQETKSEIMRDCLDSLAQSIHPRTAIVEGQVNVDDVLNNETGAVIRVRQPGMIQAFSQPFVGQSAFPMVAYLDQVKESRTGVTKASQGLNAEALQSSTKLAVNATIVAAQSRIEMVARIFAEDGLKRLFSGLLKLIIKYQDKPMIVRLRNQFIPVDPRVWNADMDVEVNVALSTSSTEEKMQLFATIINKQEQIIQTMGPNNPLVSLGQYRNTLAKTIELAGFKDTSQFFTPLPPDYQMPQPPQKKTAEELLAEVQAQSIQADIHKKAAQLELDREKMVRNDDRKRDELEADVTLRAAELSLKYNTTLDLASIKANMERDRELIKHQKDIRNAEIARQQQIEQALIQEEEKQRQMLAMASQAGAIN